jgi:hypothetical protein
VTLRAKLFLEANARSPVVYGSVENGCVYRLADGSRWHLSHKDCRALGRQPRWAHLHEAPA